MSDDRNASATLAGSGSADPTAVRAAPPPTIGALLDCFARIALLSVGGGLSGWIRRSVVERRGWMDETEFLAGFALSQLAPGPSAINLAVFVGATLRGATGAAASLLGLLAPPFVLVLVLGAVLERHRLPAVAEHALAGLGAGAIGLMIATGLRMGRRGIDGTPALVLALGTAAALAGGLHLLAVIAVALPLSLLVGWAKR